MKCFRSRLDSSAPLRFRGADCKTLELLSVEFRYTILAHFIGSAIFNDNAFQITILSKSKLKVRRLPERVQDHGEEDKLAEEGDHEGGGGDDLSQEEEEHGEREQDRDGEADLESKYWGHILQLTTVSNIWRG